LWVPFVISTQWDSCPDDLDQITCTLILVNLIINLLKESIIGRSLTFGLNWSFYVKSCYSCQDHPDKATCIKYTLCNNIMMGVLCISDVLFQNGCLISLYTCLK
jgi:hypothetical protein